MHSAYRKYHIKHFVLFQTLPNQYGGTDENTFGVRETRNEVGHKTD